ncbi:MAG: hypothetical protein SWO11_24000 [Thermodesulfobacteriota bacterium]|nr:hypothetical protein [Thermodesulfobacteriota bacterium]
MLKSPPPLETDLRLIIDKEGFMELSVQDLVIASGVPVSFNINYPSPVGYENALQATNFSPLRTITENTCFGCGARPDGMQLYSDILNSYKPDKIVASKVEITDEFVDDSGNIKNKIFWTSLDCPGAHAYMFFDPFPFVVLGRMAVHKLKPTHSNQEYYVVAWQIAEKEKRKYYTSTALHSADDELYAFTKQT